MQFKKKLEVLFSSIILIIFLIPFIFSFISNGSISNLSSFDKASAALNIPYIDNIYDIYNLFRFKFFKTTSNDTIVLGKDDMLFSSENPSGNNFEDYKGLNLFTEDEMSSINENLIYLEEYLKNQNINFYITVLPNKTTAYNNLLPKSISERKGTTKLDQIFASLKSHNNINYIDLSSKIQSTRADRLLYNKTDGNLTDLGSYYCYEEVCSKLGITPSLKIDNLDFQEITEKGGDYANKILLANYINEKKQQLVLDSINTYSNTDETNFKNTKSKFPKTLIIGDKSLDKLPILLSNDISQISYSSNFDLDLNTLKKERPKNLILQLSEDNLGLFLTKLHITSSTSTNKSTVETPSVLAKKQISSERLAIIAKAEGADELILEYNGSTKELTSSNGLFIGEIPIKANESTNVSLYGRNFSSISNKTNFVFTSSSIAILPITINNDGWFFLSENINAPELSQGQLDNIKQNLEGIEQHLLSVNPNGKLIVSIAPNKASNYTNYTNTNTDKLKATLKDSSIILADNRDTLKEAKDTSSIFYKTDTHWNSLGAFYGYVNIMDSIKQSTSTSNILTLDNFTVSEKSVGSGDLFYYLNLGSNIVSEKEVSLTPRFTKTSNFTSDPPLTWISSKNNSFVTTSSNSNLPKAILYRDSFATGMMPFLSESFSKISVNKEWSYSYDKSLTESEKPDYIIIQLVERNIKNLSN